MLPVPESKMVMDVVQAKAFSQSVLISAFEAVLILAFEDVSGYLHHLHVKHMECNGSVHLCVVVMDEDADKPNHGQMYKEKLIIDFYY